MEQNNLEEKWNALFKESPTPENNIEFASILLLRMLTKKHIKITLTKLEKSNKVDREIRKIVIDGFNDLMREVQTYGTIQTEAEIETE